MSAAVHPRKAADFKRLKKYGLHRILDRVIDCETLKSIAADENLGVSRPTLSQWLTGNLIGLDPDDTAGIAEAKERRGLYYEARRLSAASGVEDGQDALDNEQDPKAAQLANYRAQFRLKLAEKYDRETYGERKQIDIAQVGDLHLDALRKRTVLAEVVTQELTSGAPDVEVVEENEQLNLLGG